MTGVIIRRVESRLERMLRPHGGGLRVDEALEAATENLKAIEDVCRQELDARLGPVIRFGRRDPAVRPTDEEMSELVHHVDRALTACGALNLPLLGKTLIVLSAMADALRHTDYWPTGALNPAINLVMLFRQGAVADDDGEALLRQLHLCLTQYVRHAEEARLT